ncbi:MAG: LruC domain-containing protein [Halioglobus sp.]|jgi:LruC domain-containing protein
MSNTNNLFVVDATTNEVKQQYTIKGIINANGGGDLDFASDGTLYLSCFSGLYKFISFEGNTATVVRISAENFPYKLTSMAIDREDRIFVGTSDANAHLIEMNKEDGSFRIVNTYDHKINDLTAWRCATQDLEQIDSDEDGIIDELDDHPNDPEAAFDVFTPSEIGYGTLAFEDMWPTHGDYDFNDLVLNYRFANVMNSANKSVRLEMELKILAAGATFKNGFGIELPIEPSLIESVEGAQLTENIISTDSKGLELNQSKAVIIPFDNILGLFNAGSLVNTRPENGFIDPVIINITVHFKEPVDSQTLDNAPYNPFIFVNGDRSREVHLKNNPPTDLSDNSLFGTGEDYTNLDKGNSYVNQHNVPWAINMIHNFRFPVEKTRIDKAYNHLVTWGKSNGTMYADWYKDNAGYRNTNKIVFINK